VAQRRYFVAEGEPLTLRDGVAVVTREWNLHNVQNVLEVARTLGYSVVVEPKVR